MGNPFMIVMLLAMLGLMFWMQSRAKKQAAERNSFRSQLAPGQRVMTQGGLVGTIVAVNPEADTVILDSAGSRCEYMRAGIAKTLDEVALNPLATPAAAPGGLLGALGTMTGTAPVAPQVADADLADLDAITREYHESQAGTVGQTGNPIVVIEEE